MTDSSALKKPSYFSILAIIILSCTGVIIYSNTFYSSFHFDGVVIVKYINAESLSNLDLVWNRWPTRFLTYLTFIANYHFGKLEVLGYHLVNLIIHLCAAFLVYWFIMLTFSTPFMKKDKISRSSGSLALFGALIFLTHPLQTQSVTYIYQRLTSMAGFFYLFSLCLYIKARLLEIDRSYMYRWISLYVCSLVLCVIGMFVKENIVTLPIMIVLYEFCFLKNSGQIKWKYIIPFLATLPIIPLVLLIVRPKTFVSVQVFLDSPVTAYHNLLTQFRVLVTYIRLLFLPLNQNLDYDYPVSISLWHLPTIGSLFILVFIIFTAVWLFKRYRLIAFGIFWFFLTLSVESSIAVIEEVIFEHRLYLPMVGYSVFIVTALGCLFKDRRSKYIVIILSFLVLCYSILTYERNKIWKNELTLWDDTVRKSPNKARPYNNRGVAYRDQGDLDKAISDYNRAIEIDPDNAEAYNNRGIAYHDQGNLDQAMSNYNKAIEIDPGNAEAYNNRGVAYRDQGDLDKAISSYNRVIEIDPGNAEAYNNLGNAYYGQGDLDQAMSNYNRAIEIDPDMVEVYNNRGNTYRDQGDLDKAISSYNRVIEIDPGNAEAYNNLGNAYYGQGDLDQAMSNYNKAIEIDPDNAEACYNRGKAYRDQGDLDKAISSYNKAIEIDPDMVEAYNNMGNIYRDQGDLDKAISSYNKAIEIDPDYAEACYNRGNTYRDQGDLDKAISSYNKAIEIDPDMVEAYNNRAGAYFKKKEYDKSWEDIYKLEELGYKVHPEFLEKLKNKEQNDYQRYQD